ncbi:MAG: hypothetical protein U9Q04_10010 [Campylobacterota bacterium]|nr:hypothetical protein [Campylobacterota bacterium]
MIEILFYIISIGVLILTYKENEKLKDKIKSQEKHYKLLETRHENLERYHTEVEKENLSFKKEIEESNTLKTENIKLRMILQKLSNSGKFTKLQTSHGSDQDEDIEFNKLLKYEIEMLKEEEHILKDEDDMLKKDNDLLKENNDLLNKEMTNLKKQIKELRTASKNSHHYIEEINKLNNKIENLIEDNEKLRGDVKTN